MTRKDMKFKDIPVVPESDKKFCKNCKYYRQMGADLGMSVHYIEDATSKITIYGEHACLHPNNMTIKDSFLQRNIFLKENPEKINHWNNCGLWENENAFEDCV